MDGIAGILFDKDGTLFDFTATWAPWAQEMLLGLAQGDAGLAAQLGTLVGFDAQRMCFERRSVAIAGTARETAAVLAPALQGQSVAQIEARMVAAAAQVRAVPVTPLRPLMAQLRARGFALGVATNDGEAPARRQLDAAQITAHFDFIAGYDSGFGAKPAPGMVSAFAVKTGAIPATCLMVGDSLHDLKAGRAAGFRTLGVLSGPARASDLAPYADAVLPSIADLPDFLTR